MRFFSEVYWDKGRRSINQDSVSLQEVWIKGKKVIFALVCDGIGGLENGETASGFVAERMTEWFYQEAILMLKRHKSRKKIEKSGLRALYGCNEEMCRLGKQKEMTFGTTATIFLLSGRRYFFWHSGDSRIYRIVGSGINGRMNQMTKDHTINNDTLVRCIGSFSWKKPDMGGGYLIRKSLFLLCSDGFRNKIREERIKEAMLPGMLYERKQLYGRLREIAEYVKQQGERDNISAVAVWVT